MDGVKRASVQGEDAQEAVRALVEQIRIPDPALVLFFCTPDYDPQIVSRELNEAFDCAIIGCSSSGEIESGYQKGGIVGLALPKSHFTIAARFIESLPDYTAQTASALTEELMSELGDESNEENTFAFVLIDGLSIGEESFVGKTHAAMPDLRLVGGSSGDNLQFEQTTVYCNDRYGSNCAALALVHTDLAFEAFQLNHFEPTDIELITTKADPSKRVIYEINGGVAAEEYANVLGLTASALSTEVFSSHPVMLQIGEHWYVRSIQSANSDGSLTFYCAIDEGIPLSVGKGTNFVGTLESEVQRLKANFSEIALTIGCDCIHRKIEMEQFGFQPQTESLLENLHFFGFSTYGEQIDSVHVNQTLTGVVIGQR